MTAEGPAAAAGSDAACAPASRGADAQEPAALRGSSLVVVENDTIVEDPAPTCAEADGPAGTTAEGPAAAAGSGAACAPASRGADAQEPAALRGSSLVVMEVENGTIVEHPAPTCAEADVLAGTAAEGHAAAAASDAACTPASRGAGAQEPAALQGSSLMVVENGTIIEDPAPGAAGALPCHSQAPMIHKLHTFAGTVLHTVIVGYSASPVGRR